nr:MAG TPA: hypothetical protein [Caudoviricetes sp.]
MCYNRIREKGYFSSQCIRWHIVHNLLLVY